MKKIFLVIIAFALETIMICNVKAAKRCTDFSSYYQINSNSRYVMIKETTSSEIGILTFYDKQIEKCSTDYSLSYTGNVPITCAIDFDPTEVSKVSFNISDFSGTIDAYSVGGGATAEVTAGVVKKFKASAEFAIGYSYSLNKMEGFDSTLVLDSSDSKGTYGLQMNTYTSTLYCMKYNRYSGSVISLEKEADVVVRRTVNFYKFK